MSSSNQGGAEEVEEYLTLEEVVDTCFENVFAHLF